MLRPTSAFPNQPLSYDNCFCDALLSELQIEGNRDMAIRQQNSGDKNFDGLHVDK
jgi:hypothetical protein